MSAEFFAIQEPDHSRPDHATRTTYVNLDAILCVEDYGIKGEPIQVYCSGRERPYWLVNEEAERLVERLRNQLFDAQHAILREGMEVNRLTNWKHLCLKLARHLRNTDGLGLHRWGVIGMDLLAEVRKADEEAYESEVKDGPMDAQDDEASALGREFI